MLVKAYQVGQIGTNCYLVADEETGKCAVIDPGDSGAKLAEIIRSAGWTPVAILLTHSHFDHILGIPGLRESWRGLPVYCHPADMAGEALEEHIFGMTVPTVRAFGDLTPYGEGDAIAVGGLTIQVMHTPGHSPGSVVLQVEDVLFTGDTLFRGSMGRTDLNGGSFDQIMHSLARLANLQGDFKVYPGHESSSTLEFERKTNPCIHEALHKG